MRSSMHLPLIIIFFSYNLKILFKKNINILILDTLVKLYYKKSFLTLSLLDIDIF